MKTPFAAAVVLAAFLAAGCGTGQGVASANPTSSSVALPTPGSPSQGPAPSPSASASPALSEGPLAAGTYAMKPFEEAGTSYQALRITLTVPDGWAGAPFQTIWLDKKGNAPPDGAGLLLETGDGLLRDPCQHGDGPYIPIGPTVADFVGAVAKHPLLDTTTPVDVELAGYSGKAFDLQVPADISKCDVYRPWEWLYAQGPSHQWHVWVLDVDGLRVLVQSTDYPGTSAKHRAELRAIAQSIKIEP
jgi:hypothetical protein